MYVWKKIYQGKAESISHMLFFECSERETQQVCPGDIKEKGSGGREKVIIGDKIREESYFYLECNGEPPMGSEKGSSMISLTV